MVDQPIPRLQGDEWIAVCFTFSAAGCETARNFCDLLALHDITTNAEADHFKPWEESDDDIVAEMDDHEKNTFDNETFAVDCLLIGGQVQIAQTFLDEHATVIYQIETL